MQLSILLFIIGGILFVISSFWNPPSVSLANLGWACLLFGLAAGGYDKAL